MQQLEKIRNFLTGRLFFTGLDLMRWWSSCRSCSPTRSSWPASCCCSPAMIAGVVMAMVPTFQRRLNACTRPKASARPCWWRPSTACAPSRRWRSSRRQRRVWDQRSAEAITMHFRVGKISITGNAITDFLGKLLPVTLIIVRRAAVFDQTLSVGALIAFQMLSQRVTQPLISIVGLVNEYQETALSVRMLGEVMNRAPEGRAGAGGLRPVLRGRDQVRGRDLPLPRRAGAGAGPHQLHHPARHRGRHRRPQRFGQDHADQADPGPVPVQEGIVRFDGTMRARSSCRTCGARSAWCCRRTSCSAAPCAKT
jgi:subfamily B ATP-binding cassette protein HlyB/CyaB